jgi:histidinol phosphatase-like enzyme
MTAAPVPAVFLDRDGTLIPDVPYNTDPRACSSSPASPMHSLACGVGDF